jgi:hypothetical protein
MGRGKGAIGVERGCSDPALAEEGVDHVGRR